MTLFCSAQSEFPEILHRKTRTIHCHSFRRCGTERPASSRHSCAVTRGLQTALITTEMHNGPN